MSETLLEKLDRIESELKKIQSIKPPKPIKQVDYSAQISKVDTKVNELSKLITSKVEVKKEVKHVDHSKELSLINSEILAIRQSINKKQDIDIKSEVEKVVNIAYVTNLYRNK